MITFSANPQKEFEKLLKTIKKNYSTDDLDMVKLAYDFAFDAHQGQKRLTGDPYIIHPIVTAQKLAEMNLDMPTILAGLLHDVPEDTNMTLNDIKKDFGKEVAMLVDGISKLGAIKYRGIERYAENLKKMFVAMSHDIRVILIKFADRIHNLKTLHALPEKKQLRIAQESLEIYASIADRLGMSQIKGDIEDLAFQYTNPKDYQWLTGIRPKKYKNKEKHLGKAKKIIAKKLKEEKIPLKKLHIHGRTKHIYSLYKKLSRPHINRDLDKIYDLIALRIIVPTIADCYTTLGIIHELFKPVPNRIKDYIAQPKPNNYRSLHTSVFTNEGEVIEIQIRTIKMHEEAEYGIAAHWRYKEQKGCGHKKNMKWINELVKWQKQIKDNEQFLEDIKLDIFQNRIFIFSPKGDVFDLPDGATPIDFAYYVHTSLGNQCVGAKINDKMVSLDYKLKNGDIVEIIIDKNRKLPSEDWLKTAKTSMAKSKIKAALNKKKWPF